MARFSTYPEGVFYKYFRLVATLSLVLGAGACVTEPGASLTASESQPASNSPVDVDGNGVGKDEIQAIEALTGIEFPTFYKKMEDYCARNAPSPSSPIAHVDGYADDSGCGNVVLCADPVTVKGYKFVEVNFNPQGVSASGLTGGPYRIYLAEQGDADCHRYETAVARLKATMDVRQRERHRRSSFDVDGLCVAMTPIDRFEARYVASKRDWAATRSGPFNISRPGRHVTDQTTGEVVLEARSISINVSNDKTGWRLNCSNSNRDFIERALPPKRD